MKGPKTIRGRIRPVEPVLEQVLYALSDPIRLHIVQELAGRGEVSCGSFAIEMPKSSLSHHFRVLRESGVIETEQAGTQRLNRLRRAELDRKFPGLLKAVLGAR